MKYKIELSYQTPKGTEVSFTSDGLRAAEALLIAEDLEKTGRAKSILFVDSDENSWTVKDLKGFMEEIQTDPHNVTVYFDGGFDRRTKSSGLGCAIYYEQNGKSYRLRKNALVEELNTNNEAEFAAIHLGIRELELLGVHHLPVTFIGDSLVVINQLEGEWACYEEALSKWIDRIEKQLNQLGIKPEYELVSRKKNREADQLASQALNGIEITSTIEIQ
ncbi:ribonuclease H family protein [Salirhabdus salicampi]|uniref:ribonuclease H family protein n=1 Tax=Salirhabdus salicampi TaxID=476102 RepID=UPI0020C2E422|nr:ribonuclease H family protein [Salirhabdus salicampi]MCP8615683.1 ribonuclease H family protein [Salirhabdus salicampi]